MSQPEVKHPVDCEGGWIECWRCGGEGDEHDCGEDTCCCLYPERDERLACEECGGAGGWACHVCGVDPTEGG